MDIESWATVIGETLGTLSWIEGVAAGLGIASAWCIKKERVAGYPIGIVSISLYIYICGTEKLYANMGINMYYVFTSIYGWYHWTHARHQQQAALPIRYCRPYERWLYGGLAALLCMLFYKVLDLYTDSAAPLLDGMSTAVWVLASWLMANKKVEHWIGWLIGDLIALPLYMGQGLYFSVLQFMCFLVIATMGLFSWRKHAQVHKANTTL